MKKNELIEFLRCQNDFLQEKLDEALASVNSLTLANEKLTATVDELRRQIASLENLLRGKDAEVNKEKAARLAVQRLQGSSSERLGKPAAAGTKDAEKKRERNRTNNGARKKSHPECEVEIVEVEPDSPGFNPELAKYNRRGGCRALLDDTHAVHQDHLSAKEICAGWENLQGHRSHHTPAQLAIHILIHRRTCRTAVSSWHAT